jgi:ubiquinone/menaquinone biosynthesis C-methylase UbiE/intracellular sulfur oxidation DsrE/DsrF family protein
MPVCAQEKSVRPGVNDTFRDPDPKAFTERFEIESREVFAKRKEILEAIKLRPTDVVADIGAGTGLFTRLFASSIGPEGRVIAVDIAQKFLDHIEVTCREQNLRNVETLLCKDDSTELPPDSVDVAFICDTYHHFEFPQKTMTSLLKALKTGGRVIVIDFKRIEGESSDWTMDHVRAGQEVFEAEILQAGFQKAIEVKDLLKENYMVVFEKAEQKQAAGEDQAPAGRGHGEGAGRGIGPDAATRVDPAVVPVSATPPVTDANQLFPIIEGYGGVVAVADAVEPPRAGMRLVLDVTSEAKKAEEVNKGLDRAARLLNLYGTAGLKASDIRITVVLHGEATRSVLSDEAWGARLQMKHNPSLPLIRLLQKAGVEVIVCGQALSYKKIERGEVAGEIPVAAAALTVLLNRQADGFAYVPVP